MEETKRKYQKHKTEKKITVKHYLIPKHTVSQSRLYDNKYNAIKQINLAHIVSTIYVQVTYNRKSTKFRSEIRECYIDNIPEIPVFDKFDEFEDYYFNENNDLIRGLLRDANYIKWMVEHEIKFNPNFDISALPDIYQSPKYKLITFVEFSLNSYIGSELKTKIKKLDLELLGSLLSNPKLSALQNLEYFKSLYPELKLSNLKDKYGSQIWFLNLYLENFTLNNDFQMDIQGHEKYSYNTILPTSITVFDFFTNVLKRKFFINVFKKDVFSKGWFDLDGVGNKDIIYNDIDILFADYYANYDFGSFYNQITNSKLLVEK